MEESTNARSQCPIQVLSFNTNATLRNAHITIMAKKNLSSVNVPSVDVTSTWNKGVASLRQLISQKKE